MTMDIGPGPDSWIRNRFTGLGPKNLDPSDPGLIWIHLYFTGPGPDLKKMPERETVDPKDRFLLKTHS